MLLRTKVEEWKTKWDAEDSQTDWGSGIHSNHPSGLDKAHVFFYINLSEADWEAICPSPSVCWVQRPDAPDGILNRFFNNPDHSAHCERHSISPPYTRTIPCSLEESVGRQVRADRYDVFINSYPDAMDVWRRAHGTITAGFSKENLHWFPVNPYEYMDDIHGPGSSYGYASWYHLLAWRFDGLVRIEEDTKLPVAIRRAAALLVSSHIPLMSYIDKKLSGGSSGHVVLDSFLTEPQDDTLGMSPLERFCPSLDMIFHEGCMPNYKMTRAIIFGHDKTPTTGLNLFVNKTMPWPCSIRCLARVIAKACDQETADSDECYNTFLLMLAMMFMGYRFCNVWAHWRNRKIVYESIVMDCMSRSNVILWMKSGVQQFLSYTIKLWVIWQVSLDPALDAVVRETYCWKEFVAHVVDNTDNVRESFNSLPEEQVFSPWTAQYVSVDSFLATAAKNYPTANLSRPRNEHLAYAALTLCASTDDKIYPRVAPRVLRCTRRLIMTILANHVGHPEESPMLRAGQRTPGLPPFANILIAFGVPAEHALSVQRACCAWIPTGDTGPLFRVLRDLAERHIGVYALVRAMFRAYHSLIYTVRFPLPVEIVEQQKAALRLRLRLTDDTPLPSNAAEYYVCPNCGHCAATVVSHDATDKTYWSHGNSKIVVDVRTMKIYCTSKIDRSSARRSRGASAVGAGHVEALPRREAQSAAREFRKRSDRLQCDTTRVWKIDLLGSVLGVRRKNGPALNYLMLCTGCACVTSFSERAFYKGKFLCGPCMAHARQGDTEIGVTITCFICATRRNMPNESLKMRSPDQYEQRMHKILQWRKVRTLEDRVPRDTRFMDIYLCDEHSRKYQWITGDVNEKGEFLRRKRPTPHGVASQQVSPYEPSVMTPGYLLSGHERGYRTLWIKDVDTGEEIPVARETQFDNSSRRRRR